MNFSQNSAIYGLNNILSEYNGASLVMYNNPQPTTPETALAATNTALCTFTFAATAFGTPAFGSPNMSATASFVSTSVTPGASGVVTFARATLKSVAWVANATYATLFTIVSSSNNFYILTRAGTAGATLPSGTANSFIDGGCQWTYLQPTAGQGPVLADFSVGTLSTDIIIGNVNVTTTVQVTMTSFVLQTTAS